MKTFDRSGCKCLHLWIKNLGTEKTWCFLCRLVCNSLVTRSSRKFPCGTGLANSAPACVLLRTGRMALASPGLPGRGLYASQLSMAHAPRTAYETGVSQRRDGPRVKRDRGGSISCWYLSSRPSRACRMRLSSARPPGVAPCRQSSHHHSRISPRYWKRKHCQEACRSLRKEAERAGLVVRAWWAALRWPQAQPAPTPPAACAPGATPGAGWGSR